MKYRSWNARAHSEGNPSNRYEVRGHLADRHRFMGLSSLNAMTCVEDWRVMCDPSRRKICIYGAGLGRNEAPLDDPTWCVWALNLIAPRDGMQRLRADAWFDLHQRVAQTADDLRWIAACPMPIYLPPDLMDASPRAVRYPLAEIEAAFGGYWACTFAYQIALALYMNIDRPGSVTDLGLYGVELALGTERERSVEWANVSYWLGRAEERGLRIHRPRESTLGRHPHRYGLEYQAELDAVHDYTQLMRQSNPTIDVAGSEPEADRRPTITDYMRVLRSEASRG